MVSLAAAFAVGLTQIGTASATTNERYLIVAAVLPAYAPVVEIVGPSGTVERVVARPGLSNSIGARWSPDGSLLAWVGRAGLTVERADGRGRRLLVKAPECNTTCVPLTFAWSPGGRRLLVGGAGRGTEHLLVVSASTGRSVDVVRSRANTEYRIVGWSSSRDSIAYLRRSGGIPASTCCKLELFVAASNGSGPRRLLSLADGGIHDSPAGSLSPNGRWLAFTTEARDPRDPRLAVVDTRTGRIRRLNSLNPDLTTPSWSPDSRRIAITSGGKVLTITPQGKRVGSIGSSGGLLTWSRSGDLLIVRGPGSREVARSTAGRQRATRLFRLPKRRSILTIDAL
jgi:hypothetical protein